MHLSQCCRGIFRRGHWAMAAPLALGNEMAEVTEWPYAPNKVRRG